jgi:hypothetical protein
MNNKCKYLKQKIGYVYCNQLGKQIFAPDCKGCAYFERNISKRNNRTIKVKCCSKGLKNGLKQKSSKLAKLEKNRFSILVSDMNTCAECGKKFERKDLSYHEVFYGTGKRQLSIKYGTVIPLCNCNCHNQVECKGIHFDKKLRDKWHKIGQKAFMIHYEKTADEFREIFGKNYL